MSRYDNNEADPSADRPEPTRLEGIDPERVLQPDEEVLENGLPYISKSRVKKYLKCPAKFYWTYICGERAPTNYYMERGSRLHETFEVFHLNLMDYVEENGERPERFADLLPHWRNYTQWIEQIGSFIRFEERRWNEVADHIIDVHGPLRSDHDARVARQMGQDLWLPVEVEAEAWLGQPPESWVEDRGNPDYVSGEPPVGSAPWMGRADLIVDSRSLIGVDGDGVTIIDYKTGSIPDEKYRDTGIFLEGEYYGWLFERFFDVDAVAGYYPGADELIVSPYPDVERRETICEAVTGMQEMPEQVEGNGPPENFDSEPQPLCNYDGGNCHMFNICDSNWGLNR